MIKSLHKIESENERDKTIKKSAIVYSIKNLNVNKKEMKLKLCYYLLCICVFIVFLNLQ